MNTEAMFSSKTDLWATPKDFFDRLDAEFGFTLDACALPENAKCKTYYTPEQDGLAQPWEGVVWCNPPYGRQIGQWVKKAHDTATRGGSRLEAARESARDQDSLGRSYPGGKTSRAEKEESFQL